MKICYFSNSLLPSTRASAVHVMKMAHAFSDNVEKFTLFAFAHKKSIQESLFHDYDTPPFDIELKKYWRIPGFLRLYTQLVGWHIKSLGTDVAYSRFLPGSFLTQKLKIPTVTELHADQWNKDARHANWFEALVKSPYVLGFVTISQSLKNDLLASFPHLDEERILVAHDGADLHNATEDSHSTPPFAKEPGLHVGYTGSLHRGKGVDMLLQLAVIPEFAGVQFHVVGGNEDQINECRSRVTTSNITFHGFVPHRKIREYLAAFDICLLPNESVIKTGKASQNISRYTSPLKLFEYMSCSKTIISSNIDVLQEILHEGNSILVPPQDEQAWKNALNEALHDTQLRERLGQQAYLDFAENYTWNQRAKRISSFCKERLTKFQRTE